LDIFSTHRAEEWASLNLTSPQMPHMIGHLPFADLSNLTLPLVIDGRIDPWPQIKVVRISLTSRYSNRISANLYLRPAVSDS
jgi:hypothetical protein